MNKIVEQIAWLIVNKYSGIITDKERDALIDALTEEGYSVTLERKESPYRIDKVLIIKDDYRFELEKAKTERKMILLIQKKWFSTGTPHRELREIHREMFYYDFIGELIAELENYEVVDYGENYHTKQECLIIVRKED